MPKSALDRKRSGRPYRRARNEMFTAYGRICYICGHPGAGEAGHVKALAKQPGQRTAAAGMRPVHGTNARCRPCGDRACNQEQGTRDLDSMFRPKLAW